MTKAQSTTPTCKDCGSPHIQSKIKQLCGDCVFKRSHGGKSKQEVYKERATAGAEVRPLVKSKEQETGDSILELKKKYSIAKVSKTNRHKCGDGSLVTQVEINRKLSETYFKIDQECDQLCDGCGQHKALSHSHIISQQRCKQLGKSELIWHPSNIKFHCFNEGDTCHEKWERAQPMAIIEMRDFEGNMIWLSEQDPETYNKLIIKFEYLEKVA